MRMPVVVAIASVATFSFGAGALYQALAQPKPHFYSVQEVDVKNVETYTKEYQPKAVASTKAAGGRVLAAGAKVTSMEGEPPKSRVVIVEWDSPQQFQTWWNSPEYVQLRSTGHNYANFRLFTVEGLPQ